MLEIRENFPTLFNGGNPQSEGDVLEEQNENGLGSSDSLGKYGLLNFVFAVIKKSRLNYNEVFELPVMDFLVIANFVADEHKEQEKEFKRQQNLFKTRRK